jgi:hypothetical protein
LSAPENPSEVEEVVMVECLPLKTAAAWFVGSRRQDRTEIYQLAASLLE